MIIDETNILGIMALYRRRLVAFKREMETLGVKVEVTASFGRYASEIEEIQEEM